MIIISESKPIIFEPRNDGYRLLADAQFFVSLFPDEMVRGKNSVLRPNGWLYIYKHFWWDGASGAVDTKSNMRASLVHDVLINMVQAGLIDNDENTKVKIDSLYFRLAREDGMGLIRSIIHLLAIQFNKWNRKLARVLKPKPQ